MVSVIMGKARGIVVSLSIIIGGKARGIAVSVIIIRGRARGIVIVALGIAHAGKVVHIAHIRGTAGIGMGVVYAASANVQRRVW